MFDFFYSDPHFGHKNIIEFCKRPFADVAQMDRALVDLYNKKVGKNDTVCWLGDCFFDYDTAPDIMRELNGRKVLVRGNHDKSRPAMLRLGFAMVLDGPVHWHMGGRDYILSHYPPAKSRVNDQYDGRYIDRRPRPANGEIVLHGHTHESTKQYPGRIHVGVDAWRYGPVPVDRVEALSAAV